MSSVVHRYHDGTKHHFHQFARSLGYLDWASQPAPFRSFAGAPVFALFPSPDASRRGVFTASGDLQRAVRSDLCLSSRSALPRLAMCCGTRSACQPGNSIATRAIRRFEQLRMVPSRVKGDGSGTELVERRWPLRVNPSSGNLHPTEGYLVCGALPGLASSPPSTTTPPIATSLEQRCAFDADAWASACAGRTDVVLMALTSIHWREAWKYGERAFRYCQHDLGHAIAAIVVAAAMHGWRVRIVPAWSHRAVASLTGLDRDEDFVEAEREEPACLLAIGPDDVPAPVWSGGERLVAAAASWDNGRDARAN